MCFEGLFMPIFERNREINGKITLQLFSLIQESCYRWEFAFRMHCAVFLANNLILTPLDSSLHGLSLVQPYRIFWYYTIGTLLSQVEVMVMPKRFFNPPSLCTGWSPWFLTRSMDTTSCLWSRSTSTCWTIPRFDILLQELWYWVLIGQRVARLE